MTPDEKIVGYITITQLARVLDKDPRTLVLWARKGAIACAVREAAYPRVRGLYGSRLPARGRRYDVRVYADRCALVCGARVHIPSAYVRAA